MEWMLVVFAVAVVALLVIFFKNFFKKSTASKQKEGKLAKAAKKEKKNIKIEHKPHSLSLKVGYLSRKEFLFNKYLDSILGKEYAAVCKVSVGDLIVPNGDKNLFNEIANFSLDFVIFKTADFSPVLIIDVFDKSYEDQRLDDKYPQLCAALDSLNIPLMHVLISGDFDADLTKDDIYKNLNIFQKEEPKQ